MEFANTYNEALAQAKDRLPYVSERTEPIVEVEIPLALPPFFCLRVGDKLPNKGFRFTFRKEVIEGIIIGWELMGNSEMHY